MVASDLECGVRYRRFEDSRYENGKMLVNEARQVGRNLGDLTY